MLTPVRIYPLRYYPPVTDASPRRDRSGERTRREVSLPADDVHAFTELVEQRKSATVSMLAYAWVQEAVAAIRAGRGDELPRKSTVPRGGVKARVKWTQSSEEYRRCVDIVGDAGSSLEAVLLHRIRQYKEAGGDPLSMPGPPKRTDQEAA